jgi:hypothetical protein
MSAIKVTACAGKCNNGIKNKKACRVCNTVGAKIEVRNGYGVSATEPKSKPAAAKAKPASKSTSTKSKTTKSVSKK